MKKISLIAIIVFMFSTVIFSQNDNPAWNNYNQPGNIKNYTLQGNKVIFKCDQAVANVEFYNENIFRVRINSDGDFRPQSELMVVKEDWKDIPLNVEEKNSQISLKSNKLTVNVNKKPFRISVYDENGKLLNKGLTGESGSVGWNEDKSRSVKKMHPDEHFFGFGEQMDQLDWRGNKVSLYVGRGGPNGGPYDIEAANYSPVPFFMSTRGYGIFLNTFYKSKWDMGSSSDEYYSFTTSEETMDYYFIHGPEFKNIIDHYTELTGKPPLVPKAGLGLNFGSYGGGSFHEGRGGSPQHALKVAQKFRTRNIPVDNLHFDSSWRLKTEHGGNACTYEWNPNFKNPENFIDQLHNMNYKMVGVHIRSLLDDGNKKKLLTKGRQAGHMVPEDSLVLNFLDDDAVNWWWDNCAKPLADQGVQFLKTDMGATYPHDRHNVFPVAYAKAAYENFGEYGNRRGFVLNREGYAGVQRYPYIWAGDWPSDGWKYAEDRTGWYYMKPLIRAGINLGLSGVGYWSHCMGGFEANATNELYIRWSQFGLFSPISHLFGTDLAKWDRDSKEPWLYSDEAERIFKKYDRLRYRMIPYIYSSSRKMYETGVPLMRALVLDYQNNEETYDIDDQYLFGPNLMVAPVIEKGAKKREIYLPQGNWIDYWTGKEYKGEQTITYEAPLSRLPLLVKAGAIIPMQPNMEYIDEKPVDPLTLKIYPEKESSFELYQDDGWTMDYKEGEYAITQINCKENGDKVKVKVSSPEGDYEVNKRKHNFQLHSATSPSEIKIDGQNIEIVHDSSEYKNANEAVGWYNSEENLLYVKTVDSKMDRKLDLSFE